MQFGVTSVLNIAHGDFLMIGAYLTFLLFLFCQMDPFVSMIIIAPLFFLIGCALEKVFFQKFFIKFLLEEATSLSLLSSFGLIFILRNMALIIFGPVEKGYIYAGQIIDIFGAAFPLNRIITCIASLIINLLIYIFLRFSQRGRALRAIVREPIGAQLVGIPIYKYRMYALGMGAMMAALAGVLISMLYALTPFMGEEYTIIALIIMVLGGLGNFVGSFLGGIVLGYVYYAIIRFVHSSLALIAFYAIFVLILLVSPQGILTARRRR